ncbi:MAG TPA: 6-pyruvoyl-tetrahydropterin synthase-related protein [Blastocatellia bacterium]|nr:6-pyruvoyl-tetrahydropterin synthase-related protein [Blastocatellia bacterium]
METETTATRAAIVEGDDLNPARDRRSRLIIVSLWLALSSLAALPFFFMGEPSAFADGLRLQMPVTHDMHLHLWQMKSFFDGLASGEIYPRWEEDTNRGFGAPTTGYYPPAIYYLTSAFYWFAGDWMWSLLSTHLLMMLGSAAALYFYARSFMDRFAAGIAMAAYIFFPYHLLDQYQRGAMAELLGFIWMPLMLLFGGRLYKERFGDETSRPGLLSNLAGLAAATAAFLWSHPPTAYQFLLAFSLLALLLAWLRRDFKGLLILGAGLGLALALSAAYLYPAFVEHDLISHEYFRHLWPYHASYVFLHALPYRKEHEGFFNLVDAIWVFGTALILLSAIALLARRRSLIDSRLKEGVMLWVVIGIFTSFMMTSASYPLGRLIPQIETGVFTWRMLSMTALAASLLAGACAQVARYAFKEGLMSDRAFLLSLAGLITIGGALLSFVAVWGPMYRTMRFVPAPEHINYAMLPVNAPRDPLELPKVEPAELANGAGRVEIKRWDPEHRELEVILDEPDRLLIRTFNFPGWTAFVNGEPAPISSSMALRIELSDLTEALVREATFKGDMPGEVIGREPLGDIVLDLGPGAYNVKLDYLDTPPRRLGKLLSGAALILLIAIAVIGFRIRGSGFSAL